VGVCREGRSSHLMNWCMPSKMVNGLRVTSPTLKMLLACVFHIDSLLVELVVPLGWRGALFSSEAVHAPCHRACIEFHLDQTSVHVPFNAQQHLSSWF
jgi:hypothetical protein